jgi:hypothetical protein
VFISSSEIPFGGPTLQYLGRKTSSSSSSSTTTTQLHLSSVYPYQVLMLKPFFSNQQIIVNSPALLRCSRAAEVYPVLVDRKGLWGGAQSTRPWTKKNKRGKSLGHSGSSLLLIYWLYNMCQKKHILYIYIVYIFDDYAWFYGFSTILELAFCGKSQGKHGFMKIFM